MSKRTGARGGSRVNMFIVDDDLTEYLNKLESLFKTEKREIVNNLMRTLVGEPYAPWSGFIAHMMSQWNPFLYSTGQNSKYWEGRESEGMTSLEAVYTGMDIHKRFGGKPPKGVWWEFATPETRNKKDPRDRVLERDYAFFQETGIDIKAKKEHARNRGAIRRGVVEANPYLHRETVDYINQLLQLKPVTRKHMGSRTVDSMFK